jgi:hypothetical protein
MLLSGNSGCVLFRKGIFEFGGRLMSEKKEEKIAACPLMSLLYKTAVSCFKYNCAWYRSGRCVINEIADTLSRLSMNFPLS